MRKVMMPKLGETMEEGEIIKWLKKEGDSVKEGESLLEIATDKANMEVEAVTSGFLRKIVASEGEVIPVTQTIAFIADSMDEEILEEEAKASRKEGEKKEEEEISPRVTKKAVTKPVKASPLAKKLAREHSVDLSSIEGTGPAGRIVKEDILRALEQGEAQAGEAVIKEEISLSRSEKVQMQHMAKSKKEVPHVYLKMEVDFSEAMKMRDDLLEEFEKEKIHLSYTDLLIKSCARALDKLPRMNSTFEEGRLMVHSDVGVGLAVAREEGLIVPVIKKANKKDLFQIARDRIELIDKAKGDKLSLGELEGAAFTLSNLGVVGIKEFAAIINIPQVSILAVGEIKKRAVIQEEKVVIRPMMEMTLSCDHRVIDGYLGARFLQEIKKGLEKPSLLLLP
jgi:pyruvate dehydrogenase E2 component (dihydrolipoamide acetyltransferase)